VGAAASRGHYVDIEDAAPRERWQQLLRVLGLSTPYIHEMQHAGGAMQRTLVSLVALLTVGVGCGSSAEPTTATEPTQTSTVSTSETPVDPLLGTWARVNSCDAFLRAIQDAGLVDLAPEWLVGAGYFTSKAKIDPMDMCKGATEVEHSHFFTETGEFGSYDENGNQVDDGDYKVVGDRTLTFPSHAKEFGYRITVRYSVGGDTLSFRVRVPDPCNGPCREATGWALSAFYPGAFHRG